MSAEFVLVHKLRLDEMQRCKQAMRRRRSERCPKGPCACRSLGQKLRRPKVLVGSLAKAREMARESAARTAAASDDPGR